MQKHFYIYRITNLIDGKFYIGCRQSKVEPSIDPYFGSGKRLKLAIKKHDKENFRKEIISIEPTKEDMFAKERELVNEELLQNPLCYNMNLGGFGGQVKGCGKGRTLSGATRDKISATQKGKTHTEAARAKMSAANKGKPSPNKGKTTSEATRDKMSAAKKGKPKSEDHKANISAALLGKPKSPASIDKQTETCRLNRLKKLALASQSSFDVVKMETEPGSFSFKKI